MALELLHCAWAVLRTRESTVYKTEKIGYGQCIRVFPSELYPETFHDICKNNKKFWNTRGFLIVVGLRSLFSSPSPHWLTILGIWQRDQWTKCLITWCKICLHSFYFWAVNVVGLLWIVPIIPFTAPIYKIFSNVLLAESRELFSKRIVIMYLFIVESM